MDVCQARYPKAVDCVANDRAELLRFYDVSADHGQHLRTNDPIESTFATVRLRTTRAKDCESRIATLTMVFKLAHAAQRSWRKLNGHELFTDVIRRVRFVNGIKELAA